MSPFVVRFSLAEPVIVNPTIALDGILAAATYRRTGDATTAHLDLPLLRHGDIYAASEVHFEAPVFEHRRAFVSNAHWHRFRPGDFVHGGGRPVTKIAARDERKPTLDTYKTVTAPTAWAWGVGEIEVIRELLAEIDAIGKKARSTGCGRVSAITVAEVEAPAMFGLTDKRGRPSRPVPLDTWSTVGLSADGLSVGPSKPYLPRWATGHALCVLPPTYVLHADDLEAIGRA